MIVSIYVFILKCNQSVNPPLTELNVKAMLKTRIKVELPCLVDGRANVDFTFNLTTLFT